MRLNVLIKAIIQNNIVKQAGSETKSQILQTRVINVVQGHGNRNDAVNLRKLNDMDTRQHQKTCSEIKPHDAN